MRISLGIKQPFQSGSFTVVPTVFHYPLLASLHGQATKESCFLVFCSSPCSTSACFPYALLTWLTNLLQAPANDCSSFGSEDLHYDSLSKVGGGDKGLVFLVNNEPDAQSCLTLCDSVDCSWPGSSVHGILQARNTRVDCHFFLLGSYKLWPQNKKEFLKQDTKIINCKWIEQ